MSKIEAARLDDGAPVAPSSLAAISHELRTPLTGIRGAAQLLAGMRLDDEQARLVRMILSSSDSLMRLLNDLLDASRSESGQWRIDIATVPLRRLLDEAVAAWRPAAWQKGLRVRLDVAADCPEQIETDPLRVRQVLDNLIGNALKFTARGSVSLRARRTAGGRLRVEVRDTGIGIPLKKMADFFEPYRQASPAIAKNYGGTGLGLWICRQLVRQMGGEIGIDSLRGGGALVWFTLPGADRRPGEAVPEAAGGRCMRLLLVEDHPVNQAVLTAMLARLGHSVDVAADGPAAIAAVREGYYEVVLMDIHLPDVDGVAVTRQIRGLGGAAARTRIIALTADATPEDRDRLLAAGLDDHVGKPVEPAALLAALARCAGPPAGDARALLSALAARAETLAE